MAMATENADSIYRSVGLLKSEHLLQSNGQVVEVTQLDDDSVTVIGDNTIIQNITQHKIVVKADHSNLNLPSSEDSDIDQDTDGKSPSIICKPKIKLIRFPDSPTYSCTDTSARFPLKFDYKFELAVFKNSSNIFLLDFTDQKIQRSWRISVSVTRIDEEENSTNNSSSLGCLWMAYNKKQLRKLGKGKYGFWFRFQRKKSKFEITFTLKHIPLKNSISDYEEIVHSVPAFIYTGEDMDVKTSASCSNPSKAVIPKVKVLTTGKLHNQIISSLVQLMDQGKMMEFEKKASNFLLNYTLDNETRAVIKLELGKGAIYNNRLECARTFINEALELTQCSELRNVFTARAHYYLSDVCRREKKFGESESCLQIARQNLHCFESSFDNAMLMFEKAASLVYFVGAGNKEPSESTKDLIEKNFKQCIELFQSLQENFPIAKCYFAMLCMAKFLLDCRTTAGRERSINQNNLRKAEQYLDVFRTHFANGAPEGLQVQYMKACSDEHFRNNRFSEAVETAMKSLELAKKNGFNTEIKFLEERVEFYQTKVNSTNKGMPESLFDQEMSSSDETEESEE